VATGGIWDSPDCSMETPSGFQVKQAFNNCAKFSNLATYHNLAIAKFSKFAMCAMFDLRCFLSSQKCDVRFCDVL